MPRPHAAGIAGAAALLACSAAAASPEPVPATPAPVELISATPFTLERAFSPSWMKDSPPVDAGWIVVLEAQPALTRPRQVAEPVLMAGDRPALLASRGWPGRRLVALIPRTVDLASIPIWFGRPGLPEQLDAERAQRERALAERAGIAPPGADRVARALEAGRPELRVGGLEELVPHVLEIAAGASDAGADEAGTGEGAAP